MGNRVTYATVQPGMKRWLIAAVLAAVLAVTVGCGTAHDPAATQGSPGAPGVSSGRPGHPAPSRAPLVRKGWLPRLSARQVAAGHLLPRKWTLLRLTQGGTVAEIRYHVGGCLPQPKGVLVTQSATAVTLSLEATRPSLATDCAPTVGTETARVHVPGLAGRTFHHAR